MSDETTTNALEVSVSELSGKLKRTVEDTFGNVRVRGEISGFRGPHSSGHSYFSLKDERARIDAIIWRGQAAKLKHLPEEGLEVIASGKLTTYPGQSKYQIVIDALEPAGAGALMALLEERRRKLQSEGLFAEERKQLLPYMPMVIGVVTSPTGAVIRDILHRLADRFPVHVIVWPVRVQGETCGREVANAVTQLNTFGESNALPRPDVIIVARGGGSLEDLWGFNDEEAVRAVADSMIPVISAVGHETDWTLIDHAADWRAPTPTAAAERAVPVRAELEALVADLGARMRGAMSRRMEVERNAVRAAARGLTSPDMLLAMPRRRFDEAASRLDSGLMRRVERAQDRFGYASSRIMPDVLKRHLDTSRERYFRAASDHSRSLQRAVERSKARFLPISAQVRPTSLLALMERSSSRLAQSDRSLSRLLPQALSARADRLAKSARLLETLSYKAVLARGYAVVRDENNVPIMSSAAVKSGSALQIEMNDGTVNAVSTGLEKVSSSSAKPAEKNVHSGKTDGQGSLF
ncbi:exodeoxyribonuclease VII large subunit [Pseudahrensia aquimaris]|uniref:Exodeoxyribonuclease 7 large subunit n=1 Tax=Pseudahrensia aquimaris TaxID=744461 RepID=A0ABW3FCH8_9HYPH